MSLIEELQTIGSDVIRDLHGEAVTLRDQAGDISAEISDAVVSLDPPAVARDSGPAERDGLLRLAATHHAAAKASLTATIRGETWDILTVGEVYAGAFRVEIGRVDEDHSNQFGLDQKQAGW